MFKESLSVGIVEFRSIAKGIEISNEVVKKVSVKVLHFKSTCPGKFILIVSGNEGDITEVMDLCERLGQEGLIEKTQINNIHEEVLKRLKGRRVLEKSDKKAIGILEISKISSGLLALDKIMKSSSVDLISLKLGFGIGGKIVYIISGELSDIENGIEIGIEVLKNKNIIGKSIIPVVHDEILEELIKY